MPFYEAIRLAFAQIRVQKLKSFFTLLGVMIGVMFLIAVVSIVSGMGNYMKNELVGKLIALNSFELRQRPNLNIGDVNEAERRAWRLRPSIYEYDVPEVAASLATGTLWAEYSQSGVNVESQYGTPRRVTAYGVSDQYFTIKRMGVTLGRLPSPQEYILGSPVIVIGKDVQDHFFPDLNPLGRELKVAGVPYSVIGVAETQGSAFGMSFDGFLVAPARAPIQRLLNPHGVVDAVIVQSPTEAGISDNEERVREVMRARHRLRPEQADDFTLETSDSALAFWKKIQGYLVMAGVALPAIGLVVGAIVIMNIMLVAVAERTREIGIRKALGARRRDILRQFLVESTTLAMLGAAVGVALGFALAKLISALTPLPASVELWSVVVGVSVGAGVGIIAGVYPASRAALLDPIAALRQE
ncbi:MAG TPA: ABC transporter permease [Gemmatimonadaceae bacterium]|nr:ABC transporter permease [Gemmatimonadaceae bacterium]